MALLSTRPLAPIWNLRGACDGRPCDAAIFYPVDPRVPPPPPAGSGGHVARGEAHAMKVSRHGSHEMTWMRWCMLLSRNLIRGAGG